MVADRAIPIKYNSLLGYYESNQQDDFYYYQKKDDNEQDNFFMTFTQIIPLSGWITHDKLNSSNVSINKTNSKHNNNTQKKNSKDLRREKRKLLFKSKMMNSHYTFSGGMNSKDLSDDGMNVKSSTLAYMIVMVRKDTSSRMKRDEDFCEGVSNYKIALMNMRRFRIVTDLEDVIFLDLEMLNGHDGLKYFEVEGKFSRRNHYQVSYMEDDSNDDENHIVTTGLFTFKSEGLIVKFRLSIDRLEITNTKVLVENYSFNNSQLLESISFIESGKFPTPLNCLFSSEEGDSKSMQQTTNGSILYCESETYWISNCEVFSVVESGGGGGSNTFLLNKDETLSNSLVQHLEDNSYQVGEVCKLTECKYLAVLEKSIKAVEGSSGGGDDEINLVELFENSKWILIDLYSKSITSTSPTIYKTRNEEDFCLDDGFTAVAVSRKRKPRHFLTNYGGELNGGLKSEIEKLILPKFAINRRSMHSMRPFKSNPDCFLVKTFLTSSKIEHEMFEYMKAEMLPVAHFTLYFHIKEEAIPQLLLSKFRSFTDLQVKCF